MTEQYEKMAKELANALNQFSENVNKILKEMFTLEGKTEKDWEMKCPYKDGDEYYFVSANGLTKYDSWDNYDFEKRAFAQGNIFKTQQEAELEAKRRNLLTRFRAFRDECNDGWTPDWTKNREKISLYYKPEDKNFYMDTSFIANTLNLFGYFKNKQDAERAIELFGDEIKKLFVEV